ANSKFIARRIKKVYGRDADVIYPPVNVDRFNICERKDDYFFTASRLVPYKKMDLIVEAFSQMPDKKLVVIGDGSEMSKIKQKATKNIEILGYQPDATMTDYMKKAKAFVFAAEEDFGITPVEAQACGTPVIAFGKGGVLETIKGLDQESPTGVFFYEQKVDSLINA
ncbi:glycosyltransferase, partial [Klebsiella pneumoniae]